MPRISSSNASVRVMSTLVVIAFVASSWPLPAADQLSDIHGKLLDPSGNPAEGFKVVVRDLNSGTETVSAPSGAGGDYSLQLQHGTGFRYKIVHVLAPDGTVVPVQDMPPLRLTVPSSIELNFRILPQQSAREGPLGDPTCTDAVDKDKDGLLDRLDPDCAGPTPSNPRQRSRWWRSPGGVAAIVIASAGTVAAIAAAGGNNNDDDDDHSMTASRH